MKISLQVNEGPYQHQASDSAYQFARAAILKGHQILRIFFYHDGVYNSSCLTRPPQDDRAIVQRWSELAAEHQVDLVVCIAAAQRRGIVDASEAQRHQLTATNLAPGFRIAGLGQLIEATLNSDRFIQFGD